MQEPTDYPHISYALSLSTKYQLPNSAAVHHNSLCALTLSSLFLKVSFIKNPLHYEFKEVVRKVLESSQNNQASRYQIQHDV
jgi:hypothetical protein